MGHIPRAAWMLVAAALLALDGSTSRAAETSASPRTEAGPEEQRFRRRATPQEPQESVVPSIEDRTSAPEAPPVPAGPAFLVRTVRLEGRPLIPEGAFRAIAAPYEGRALTFADLQQLTQALTHWLRRRGYVTSRVSLPPQDVTDGVVTLRLLDGLVGAIRVEGATHSRPTTLRARMQSRPGALLNYPRLQGDLARLNATPDRRVAAVLMPGEAPGTTDVVLNVDEQSPIHAGLFAHNAGARLSGRFRHGLILGHHNLTGHDDQLVVRTERSPRTGFLGTTASYLIPLGASGRTVGLDASHADVQLGMQFRPSPIEGRATVLGLTWSEPIIQRPSWEAEWNVGIDGKRIRSREGGGDRGKDDLRVLRTGPNWLGHDPHGRGMLTTELGIGFSRFLGSSRKEDPAASRTQTGGQFVRLTVAGGRLQRLWGQFQLLARGAWQWTDDRLPPAEMLQIGGAETVRGYPQGEFLGDYGYVGTVEVRAPLPWGHRRGAPTWSLAGFYDGGAAFLRKPLQTEEAQRRLQGVGVGLRWTWSPSTSAVLDLALPVGDTSSEDEDRPRIHYAVNLGF
ncbi:MAG: ShlB/FhaC/HecB family hemolysin secretion/activation protein [Candidatus Omnitrophica bacterium]|nr:ShlB/FhaC/HecB family hemolysin secretion/activation protein [Candidatus Omnitrophota bacterium]